MIFLRPGADGKERQVWLLQTGCARTKHFSKFNLRSIEFARYEKHGNKCSFSFPSDLRKIFTLKALPYASRDEKKVSIYVVSKCPGEKQNLLSNTVNLPTQIDSSTSQMYYAVRVFKKENHIFCCCFFSDSTYSDFFLLHYVTYKSFLVYC